MKSEAQRIKARIEKAARRIKYLTVDAAKAQTDPQVAYNIHSKLAHEQTVCERLKTRLVEVVK